MEAICSRLLVARFYKVNAGFFLFVFIVLFAILPGTDTMRLHFALMDAATSSLPFTLIALLVAALYNLKCVAFTLQELKLPENTFLYNLQAASNIRQLRLMLASQIAIYLPMLLYSTIMAVVGFRGGHALLGSLVLLWQLAMCAVGAWVYQYTINGTYKSNLFQLPELRLFPKKNFLLYLFYFSLENKKGTFIAIKAFSLLLLQFLVILNDGKASKENVCFLVLFCISAHALLPNYYVRFTEQELRFTRNLPISLGKRLATFIITYALIFIPEILFLLYNERNVLPLPLVASIYALAVSRLTLFTAMQYLPGMGMERYTTIVLTLFFVSLVLLASLPLWGFIAIETTIAISMYAYFYYRYEGVLEAAE